MERFQILLKLVIWKEIKYGQFKLGNITWANNHWLSLSVQGRKSLLFFKFELSKFCAIIYG